MAKVNIIENGRSGTIRYIEGWWNKKTYEFYWEFGGGDTIMAKKVRRKQAPLSKIQWAENCFELVRRW